MLRVGLTGGIGAGKSAVAGRLAERGAVLVDADRLAREVLAPGTEGLAEVVAAFGARVLDRDGVLDRAALGARVFAEPRQRRRLEEIVHPRVRRRTAELTAAAAPDAVVVNDVPLLVETGLAPSYHLVVVVEADRDVRVRRLAGRGLDPADAAARIAAQADDASRRAAADVLLDNDGDLAALHTRVDRLWYDRLRPYEENLRRGRAAPVPDAPPHIVGADPAWPQQADRLTARIRHELGPVPVAHIGSTAVPGLPAKDVLDLMLTVPTLADADALAAGLVRAGLPRREGEWPGDTRVRPGAIWPERLHGSADPGRPANLHVRVAGTPGWRFALLVRDHLRADAAARDGYAAAKRRWAAEHADLSAYAEAKEPWFAAEADAAQEWAVRTGWTPPRE